MIQFLELFLEIHSYRVCVCVCVCVRACVRGLHGLKTEARTRPVPDIVWPNPTRPERHS